MDQVFQSWANFNQIIFSNEASEYGINGMIFKNKINDNFKRHLLNEYNNLYQIDIGNNQIYPIISKFLKVDKDFGVYTIERSSIKIEYFYDDAKHSEFDSFKELATSFSQDLAENQVLSFLIARIYTCLLEMGAKSNLIRFRKTDNLWSIDFAIDDIWAEFCVLSDSKSNFTFKKRLEKPILIPELRVFLNTKTIDLENMYKVKNFISNQSQESLAILKTNLEVEQFIWISDEIILTRNHIQINNIQNEKHFEETNLNAINILLSTDIVLYSILKQNFLVRNNNILLTLNNSVLIYDVSIFSVLNDQKILLEIKSLLQAYGLRCFTNQNEKRVDKKYLLSDQLGIPYSILIDLETETDHKVKIRNRDTMKQIRIEYEAIVYVLNNPDFYFTLN